jgi:hypothetical protein
VRPPRADRAIKSPILGAFARRERMPRSVKVAGRADRTTRALCATDFYLHDLRISQFRYENSNDGTVSVLQIAPGRRLSVGHNGVIAVVLA